MTQVNALRAELVTMVPRYPSLTLPVELVHGTEDTVVPLDIHSQPLSQLLPNVTLSVIPGAGHMLPQERDGLVSGVLVRLIRPHL